MNQYIIYGAVGLVVLFVIVYVKMTIDEKKGANSEEKRKIKEIVKRAVPNGESYTAAYGTTEDFEIGGGGRRITTTTTYRYFAVAFQSKEFYLVPLSFDGGDVSYSEPLHYTADSFGMAEAGKGMLTLYDKDRRRMFTLFVVESNTKDDKYHPVNIQQKEEAELFAQFSRTLMQNVNAVNGITDLKAAKKEAGRMK